MYLVIKLILGCAICFAANWITKNLTHSTECLRYVYRMFGTYIAYTTVLFVIYALEQNIISFGYLCLLLFWVMGRQVVGKSERRLWLPLMVFAGLVFVVRYILSAFSALQPFIEAYIPLFQGLGFDPAASMFGNLWDCLTILVVMQLFRFERTQTNSNLDDSEQAGDHINLNIGYIGFLKRFLILHSGKILSIAVFYAAISPVSAFGFLYLVMLVVTCNMAKTSRLPGQVYAQYTALLMILEYLFQMWGEQEEMFLGQVHGEFAYWLGLRTYGSGFYATEAGMRSKALVLVACTLQCTSLGWLELLPASLRVDERYEEPCLLFLPYPRRNRSPLRSSVEPSTQNVATPSSQVFRDNNLFQSSPGVTSEKSGGSVAQSSAKKLAPRTPSQDDSEYPPRALWGNGYESRQWTKRAVLLQKHDRYEAQMRTLNIFAKHVIEHFCQLYGLEISMLALLVASFALLNVVSLVYISILALCILLNKRSLRTVWPFFVVLFGCILVFEYAVLGKSPPEWTVPDLMLEKKTVVRCADCLQSYTGHFSYCWQCWLGNTF